MTDKPNGKGYSPMGVLGMLKSKGVNVPVGPRNAPKAGKVADAFGNPVFQTAKVPDTCAILLLAFTKGAKIVPDDFHAVEKTGKGLREYVRPDGGVYLGAFQPVGEPDGVVIVYGDPAMSQRDAQRIATQYRDQLIAKYEGELALDELGPFAAGAVSDTPPAVLRQEGDALPQ